MRAPVLSLIFFAGLAAAQYDQQSYATSTPVPILKQINKQNEDGSYSYGFEAADGSYKIESKYPNGEIYGKYGFVDDTGKIREIEYGASKNRGFEPVGPGINVPPPTVQGNAIAGSNEPEDDGQYREDPSIYHTDPRYTNGERYEDKPAPQAAYAPAPARLAQPAAPAYRPAPAPRYPQPVRYQQPASNVQYQQEYRPEFASAYQQPAHQQAYQQASLQGQRTAYANPAQLDSPQRHSATRINVNSGLASYSVNYR